MLWKKNPKKPNYSVEVNVTDGDGGIKVEFVKGKPKKQITNIKTTSPPVNLPSTSELVQRFAMESNSPFFPNLTSSQTLRVREALASSFANGEDNRHLIERLTKVLPDTNEVEEIAYTESVYLYSKAVIEYGLLSGAIAKIWTGYKCCDDCELLSDKQVGIKQQFSKNDLLGHPPLHKKCSCSVYLKYKK